MQIIFSVESSLLVCTSFPANAVFLSPHRNLFRFFMRADEFADPSVVALQLLVDHIVRVLTVPQSFLLL